MKRLTLAIVVAALALVGVAPARAVAFNNLSFQNTSGLIRLHPVFQDRTGLTVDQAGDSNAVPGDPTVANPNRTVGDFPFDADFRTLAANPGSGDGHTHYHLGSTTVFVNDVTGFRAGDTILIGSPYCNFPFLGLDCEQGLTKQQPIGEIAHVIGGDVAPGDGGPGVLFLAEPLSKDNSADSLSACNGYALCTHESGEQVVKLQTGYTGQQFNVVVRPLDACGSSVGPINIAAGFIPPQGSHNPAFPQRPLTIGRGSAMTIRGLTCPPPPGAGPAVFYIPHEVTGLANVGRSFDFHAQDDWYTVIVTATQGATVVSDGVLRFKLNSINMTRLQTDRETPSQPGRYFPLEAVNIAGSLRDNSSAVALNRPVEDVIVDVSITDPLGLVNTYQTTSCVDTDPSVGDSCGGNVFGGPGNHHGDFFTRIGGLQGLFIGGNIVSSTLNCQNVNGGFPFCALDPVFSAFNTIIPGTYTVDAFGRGIAPWVTDQTTFDVSIL